MEYLNRHYSGWTLEAIRADLLLKLASESERYSALLPGALELCNPAMFDGDPSRKCCGGNGAICFDARTRGHEPLRELLSRSKRRESWWRC